MEWLTVKASARGAFYLLSNAVTLHPRRRRSELEGATSPNIDIYRNNVLIATQPNEPGVYIDSTGDTGRARYRYRVCEAGTATCSNVVIVRFP